MSGRRWTAEEERRLEDMIDSYTVEEIAKRLNRSFNSVNIKLGRMGLSGFQKSTDMLTMNQIHIMLGVEPSTVKKKWCGHGLKMRRKGTMLIFRQEDLIRFLKRHPEDWNAARVTDDSLLMRYEWYREKRARDTRTAYYWTGGEVSTLKRMYQEGRPMKEIAAATGRSETGCKQKIHKLRCGGFRI